jgi:hypothetical protein
MPSLACKKFKSGMSSNMPVLYRTENNRGKEAVFAISMTDMTILQQGDNDIDFDAKSDEILSGLLKTSIPSHAYFKWVETDFFPCKPEEIGYIAAK